MTNRVDLSDEAFEALDRERREGESDSEVLLRLIEEARSTRKDPWHFVRSRSSRERVLDPEEHLEMIERMDAVDREKARRRWEERHGDAG